MKKFVLAKKYWLILILLIAVFGWWYLRTPGGALPPGVETGVVKRGEVLEVVSETGHVEAAQAVDLAFERGGRVLAVLVSAGDKVEALDPLVTLDPASASADLVSAQARLSAEQARLQELRAGADSSTLAVTESSVVSAETALENAKRALADVTAQQNQLVSNAKKTLLTSGLQAYLVSDEREGTIFSYTAPTVTGSYESEEEGVYTLELYRSNAESGSSYSLSGLENGVGAVTTVSPSALGTRGLFLQFPTDFAKGTTWEIPIPNTHGSSYITNLNLYQATVKGREVAIANAESAVTAAEAAVLQAQTQLFQVAGSARAEKITAQRALVTQMQAAVASAELQMDNLTLTAPYAGVITKTNVQVGQIVNATVPAVSLISEGQFELKVAISEVDIAELSVGDKAEVTFDAYDDMTFAAHVVTIAPSAELVDGVRVFTVTLLFDEKHELIRDGLSADIDITTAKKEDVISIPTRAIYQDESGKFVRVASGDTVTSVYITTGLRGSDGNSEVLSGLNGGETIITFADEDALKQIERK